MPQSMALMGYSYCTGTGPGTVEGTRLTKIKNPSLAETPLAQRPPGQIPLTDTPWTEMPPPVDRQIPVKS